MKKKWIAGCAVSAFFLSACVVFWMEKPALTQMLNDTVRTTANSKLNGTLSFDSMDISLSGKVIISRPVIRDTAGQVVLEGDDVQVYVNPSKILPSLRKGAVLEALDTIDIRKPVLHVWEGSDGTWNIASLIRTNNETKDTGFRGTVRLQEGTVRTRLPGGQLVVMDNLQGGLSFANYPTNLAVNADGYVDGQAVSISGTYKSSRHYNVVVQARKINALYGVPFLPDNVDVALHSGTVENVKVRVANDREGFFLSGQADVSNGSASAYGVDIDGVTGHVDVSSHDVKLHQLRGTVNGQAFRADGTVVTNGSEPVFDIAVDAPSVSLDAFSDILPVSAEGTAGFSGKIWGSASRLNGQGKLRLSHVSYNGWSLDDGSMDISYSDHVLQAANLELSGWGGTVRGKATYQDNTGAYAASLQAEHIDLSQVPQVSPAVAGSIDGTVQVSGNSQDHSVWAAAHVEAAGLSYNGLDVQNLSADATYANDIVQIADLRASVGGGTIQGGGTYDVASRIPDISFTAHEIPLDVASPYAGIPMSGTASLTGHVYGSDWNWDVQFNAANGAVQQMPFDSIDGSVRGRGRIIEIPALYWRYVDGVHTLQGRADLDSREVQGSLKTEHMRIEKLLPAIGRSDIPMTGWADNVVTFSGPVDRLKASGAFRLTSGSYSGYLYKNISADYRVDDGTVYLKNGDISSYNASVSLAGSIGKSLDLTIEGRQLDIARMMPGNKLPRSGLFNIKAHVGGTMDNPAASGELRSDSLTINGMPLMNVHGDFAYYDRMMRLTDLHVEQNGGSFDGNLLYRTEDGLIRGMASVQGGDIASALKLAGVPVQHVEGRVDGRVDLSGTLHNPTAAIQGSVSQASLAGMAVSPTDIDVKLENGVITVNKLALEAGSSLLAAQGTYAIHGPAAIQFAARNFPSKVLLGIAGRDDIQVDAPIDFSAELGGSGDDLTANVSAQLGSGTINGISFTNAVAMLNIGDGNIHIQQAYLARDPYKAAAYGDIPVSALHGGRGAEPMNVTVKLDNAGLDALTFLTPWITSAQGDITGSLKIGGTLADPQIYGSLGVQDGSMQIRGISYPLRSITGQLAFNGTSASVEGSATMDKEGAKHPGTVALQGQASWQGWQFTKYSGSLDADRLAVDSAYFTGPLTGHLSIAPGDAYPRLGGIITVDNATIDVPLSLSESTVAPNVELDVTLALGDKVRLYNPALYDLMVNGAVTFKGTASHPAPSGRFEANGGKIHYLDTNFSISKAKADFSQMDSFLPVIDLEGTSRVGQYNVLLTLRGPVDSMDMLLRSNPPLTRQQIISLITLRNSSGKQQSSLTEEDMNALVGSGIRLTLNSLGITQELERALSLDMVTVTNGSLDLADKNTDMSRNYYNIEMGKYLFNNFMVTAAFGLNHDDNRFGIQYDLGSKFSLNAWTSDDNAFAGGLYRYSFW